MDDKPIPAFVLSLIGGMLILLPGLLLSILRSFYGWMYEGWHMEGWHMMGWNAWAFPGIISTVGLVSGLAIVLSSFMLYSRPRESSIWGTVILAFSVISLVGMGGFFIGFLLALIGGVLALAWKPEGQQREGAKS